MKKNAVTIEGKKYVYLSLLYPKDTDGNYDVDKAIKKYQKFNEENTSLFILANNAKNIELVRYNEKTDSRTWSSVKWTTAMADFKKRKFKCNGIHYNETTGRVDSIKFIEK